MTAGRRNTLVQLQTYTVTQDGAGEEEKTWTTVAEEWAAVFYGRGDERRQAAKTQASQTATFQMPRNSVTDALLPQDQIVHAGADWDITGPPALDTPERGLLEVEATRAA
jgi:head-tail adaptor